MRKTEGLQKCVDEKVEEEIHTSARTDSKSLVKSVTLTAAARLAQSSGLVLQLSCCRSSPFSQVFGNWVQEEVPYQTQACFKTEFPLKKKKRHLRQTVFISISHIIRNYCATLTIIINTNNVQSLLSGQSDIMLQYIQISKAF